ncbi:acetyltransferase, partial [Saprospiraceae bacterium]|nr:acetyltransferase [Saprospiraceae bacterium]
YDPFLEETNYWGKEIEPNLKGMDIYIGEETDLGKGYGEIMILMAFERSFEDPSIKAIIIDPLASNVRAIKFYERIGFDFIEARVFGTTDCMYYRLNREKWLDLYK